MLVQMIALVCDVSTMVAVLSTRDATVLRSKAQIIRPPRICQRSNNREFEESKKD